MKKLIGLFMIIMSLTACNGVTEDKTLEEGWNSFTENGYSIHYPENWELDQSGLMGTSFFLFSPLSSEKDQFRENVNLMIQDLSGQNIDLDKYTEISEGQVETMITHGKILESKRMTAATPQYQKIQYTGTQGIFNLMIEQYYWIVNEKAYVVTFTSEEEQFDDYKVVGEQILNSFKIIE